jgi:hypothetical protein
MNNINKTIEEIELIMKYKKIYYDYGFREGNRYIPRLYNFMKDADYINGRVKKTDREKLFEKFLFENELTSQEQQLDYIKFLKLKYGENCLTFIAVS